MLLAILSVSPRTTFIRLEVSLPKSKLGGTFPRIRQISWSIDISIIIDAFLLHNIQIRLCNFGDVNVFSVFQATILLAFHRRLSLSRKIYPILWRTQLPLHASALLHWRLWLPYQHHSSPCCWSCASTLRGPQQNARSSGLRIDAGRHLFSVGEKNVALSCSFNF